MLCLIVGQGKDGSVCISYGDPWKISITFLMLMLMKMLMLMPKCRVIYSGNSSPPRKIKKIGFQNNNLAITRRQEGLRSSRFQLSAYFCTLFLVRCVPWLKSFNLIDLMNLGVRSGEVG